MSARSIFPLASRNCT